MATIPDKRLAVLLEKERAHDDYLAATREVRAARARIETSGAYSLDFVTGYSQALRDFAKAIVDAANARNDDAQD